MDGFEARIPKGAAKICSPGRVRLAAKMFSSDDKPLHCESFRLTTRVPIVVKYAASVPIVVSGGKSLEFVRFGVNNTVR
jgi:hypothetical protein